MGLCLILLGWLIGEALVPSQGGVFGILAAGVIWTILSLVSYFAGDSIVLSSGCVVGLGTNTCGTRTLL